MSYTTLAKVQALMARINSNAAFSSSTVPKDTQITNMITDIGNEIDTYLATVGYATPVTAPARVVGWLDLVNQYGAVALVLKSAFPEQQQSSGGGPVEPAYAFYEQLYTDALDDILTGEVKDPDAATGTLLLMRSYLADNPANDPQNDGDLSTQQPVFSMGKVF